MILTGEAYDSAIKGENEFDGDPLVIKPDNDRFIRERKGGSSVDLRLGRWFVSLRETSFGVMDCFPSEETEQKTEAVDLENGKFTKPEDLGDSSESKFIPFGRHFTLHPGHFVLGSTLEWVKIPQICVGDIVGKSSWARHGLLIEAAPIVHPGFTGCLTLELANVGQVPMRLHPGTQICQLQVSTLTNAVLPSGSHAVYRRPVLKQIVPDKIASDLHRADRDP